MEVPALHEVRDEIITDTQEALNLAAAWNVALPEDILAVIQGRPFVRRQFCRQSKAVWEVLIFDLEKIDERTEEEPCAVRGKRFLARRYRRKGLSIYISGLSVCLAAEASFCDYGPDGICRSFTGCQPGEPAEAERAESRRRIRETVTRALARQGIW